MVGGGHVTIAGFVLAFAVAVRRFGDDDHSRAGEPQKRALAFENPPQRKNTASSMSVVGRPTAAPAIGPARQLDT